MKRCATLGIALLLAACGGQASAVTSLDAVPHTLESAERWGEYDDPGVFGDPLEKLVQNLPTQGAAARTPWTGSYWPKYLDGINYPWAGPSTESPAHKYARAFRAGTIDTWVSNTFGIHSDTRGAPCFHDGLCGPSQMCARKAGSTFGRCMAIWFGVCHAWAPASILFEEPRHDVWYNGVHFDVTDIKALLTVVHNSTESRRISLRCEDEVHQIEYDAVGRPTDESCRDSNPGTYHLLLANYLGIRKESFIEDRSMDKDVWNQPLRSFRVTDMREVSWRQANSILGLESTVYPYNHDAQRFVYVRNEVSFIREAEPEISGYLGDMIDTFTFVDTYEYILELTRNGEIIGGEWVGASKSNHPDFLWKPLYADVESVAGGAIRYDNVMEIVRRSYE